MLHQRTALPIRCWWLTRTKVCPSVIRELEMALGDVKNRTVLDDWLEAADGEPQA